MRIFFLIISVIGFPFLFSAHSQTSKRIVGKVVDQESKPLPAASIIIFQEGKLDSLKLISNQDGYFEIDLIQGNKYRIKVSYIGFETSIKYIDDSIQLNENDVIILKLFPSTGMMANITLESQKIQIKEDTISYKIDSTMYRKNDNIETMLKNLPGIQVEKDGTILAQGKQVTKVKVNGKDFFNGDVTVATRELNADMVDRIQVIDDYGDQAAFTGIKDGDPSKTINIELRKDKNKGTFGNLTGGAGSDSRYISSVTANYFNNSRQISVLGNLNNINANLFNMGNNGGGGGGNRSNFGGRSGGGGSGMSNGLNSDGVGITKSGGLNYRDEWGKKISFYGSYSYSDKTITTLKNTDQQTVFQDKANSFHQFSDNFNWTKNHRISSNIEYKIDTNNYLKFNISNIINSSENTYFSFFDNSASGKLLSKGENQSNSTSNSGNLNGSLLYNHRFRKKGRTLSLNLNAGKNETQSSESVDNQTLVFRSAFDSFPLTQSQRISQDYQTENYGARISYTEPIGSTRNLEFNYSYTRQQIDNLRSTYVPDTLAGNGYKVDSILSNYFENDYQFQRFGINLKTTLKKYNYTIGFSAQPATISTNSITNGIVFTNKLVNFFPVVRFAYNFSKSRSFNVNYNGNTVQPTNVQLLPVADRSNPQFITLGNPNLRPEFNNVLNIRYNNFDMISGNVFFGNLSVTYTNDKIVNDVRFLSRGGSQEITYKNTNGFWTANAFYNVTRPIKNRKYVFNWGGNVNYTRDISFVRDSLNVSIQNIGRNWTIGQRFTTDIKVKKWLETTIGIRFNQNISNYSIQQSFDPSSRTLIFSSNSRIFLPKDFIISYDFDKKVNQGFSSNTEANPFIIQLGLEKQFLKTKNLTVKFQAIDVLNQNIGISRTLSGNGYTDTRTNRLGRYFLLSFVCRLNKFVGDIKANDNPMRQGGDYKNYRQGMNGF